MTTHDELKKMTVKALRDRIKAHNIRGYSKMKKGDLIYHIAGKEGIRLPPQKATAKIGGTKPQTARTTGAPPKMKTATKSKAPAKTISKRETDYTYPPDGQLEEKIITLARYISPTLSGSESPPVFEDIKRIKNIKVLNKLHDKLNNKFKKFINAKKAYEKKYPSYISHISSLELGLEAIARELKKVFKTMNDRGIDLDKSNFKIYPLKLDSIY